MTRLIVDLRETVLEINQWKSELMLLNHNRDESLQTEVLFIREVLPELVIDPFTNPSLLRVPFLEEGIS